LTKISSSAKVKYTTVYTLEIKNMSELIRLSISEAARLFGINSQTIRRAIKNQEITYVVVLGRYQLNFESVLKWSQNNNKRRNKMAQKGIGQFVDRWKIGNKLYSPNPKSVKKKTPPSFLS